MIRVCFVCAVCVCVFAFLYKKDFFLFLLPPPSAFFLFEGGLARVCEFLFSLRPRAAAAPRDLFPLSPLSSTRSLGSFSLFWSKQVGGVGGL